MDIESIKKIIKSSKYEFLRTDQNLGDNIILLGLGGSHAYGTDTENSDLDVRGIATNSRRNILIRKDFEQIVERETDTTIYSFEKIVKLLSECNPNTIEILGLKPEHYLYLSPIGKALIENRHLFLSQKAIYSFAGYANAQLRRLENKSARLVDQTKMEESILRSISHADVDFRAKYFDVPEDGIKLYIDKSNQEGYDSEIFMDITLKHYPLRDYCSMWSEMNNIVKTYSKFGARNKKAVINNKLGKHMMHLVRLYLMCFDILEYGEIITYRTKEHDFLMSIRSGDYLDKNNQPTREFYKILDDLEKRLEFLSSKTTLPEQPDKTKIDDFVMDVNEQICIK